MPFTTAVSMWVVTFGPTVVLIMPVVNPALVDRWISIAVAADGVLALFVPRQRHRLPPARGFEATRRGREADDGEGEGLGGVRTDTVLGGDPKRVRAAGRAGVPESAAVPSPLSLNLTPRGSAPVSDKAGVGTPVDVTVKVPAWPTVKVVPAALVIPGAWLTVRVSSGWRQNRHRSWR